MAILAALVLATAASAAAPRLILVDQGGLERPIVLSAWTENHALLTEWYQGRPIQPRTLRGRPSFRLSFMWGPEWNAYVDSGKPLGAVRPSQTTFHGRFWPAVRDKPAVINPGHGVLVGPRTATRLQLRIFARHRVPIRIRSA